MSEALPPYKFKPYATAGVELIAGFYSTEELRDLVKALNHMTLLAQGDVKPKISTPATCKVLTHEISQWNIGQAYELGIKAERKRIIDLLQAQNKHKHRQNFYAYVIKLIEEPA